MAPTSATAPSQPPWRPRSARWAHGTVLPPLLPAQGPAGWDLTRWRSGLRQETGKEYERQLGGFAGIMLTMHRDVSRALSQAPNQPAPMPTRQGNQVGGPPWCSHTHVTHPSSQPAAPSLLTRQGHQVGGSLRVRPFLNLCYGAAHGGGGVVRLEEHLQDGRGWVASGMSEGTGGFDGGWSAARGRGRRLAGTAPGEGVELNGGTAVEQNQLELLFSGPNFAVVCRRPARK